MKRLEAIQEIADLQGEAPETVEYASRAMSAAPGRYSTKIGSGRRVIDVGPDWIASTYLAALCSDPKNAAAKVQKLGNLRNCEFGTIVRRSVASDPPQPGINALFSNDRTEKARKSFSWSGLSTPTLLDLFSDLIRSSGTWLFQNGAIADCPVPDGFSVALTLTPDPRATVSFKILGTPGEQATMEVEFRDPECEYKTFSFSDHPSRWLQRTVIVPHGHILCLGKIYAHSLAAGEAKKQVAAISKNEKADNPARSPASSKTVPHDDPETSTGTRRKDGLHKPDLSARVRVSSRGLLTPSLRIRHHDPASRQHGLPLA